MERFSALFAGALAGAVALTIPVPLLELAAASTGLSEVLPGMAPPLGWPARILVALVAALAAVAVAWALDGAAPSSKRKNTMAIGWHNLARFARGADRFADDIPARPPVIGALAAAMPDGVIPIDAMQRRRADLHPDAPPRPPLFASRDLPKIAERPAAEKFVPPAQAPLERASAATIPQRPLPRSPEPFSDAELLEIQRALGPSPMRPVVSLSEAAPEGAGSPLLSLVDHFEQQVRRRMAPSAAGAQSAVIEPPVVAPRSARPDSDEALRAALETLRRLSEQVRKN